MNQIDLKLSKIAILAATLGLLLAGGCSEPRDPPSVKSDDPILKVPAIKQDVRRKDKRDAALMVKDLDDDDPAVRFYAIGGLKRITGKDFGYRYYDDENQRRPAIERWNAWLKQQH